MLLVVLLHLGHRLRDHVHVLHGQDRQLDADHAADLPRPQAAGVDDVLGVDLALLGDDIPRPVGALAEVGHHRVPVDLGAGVAGADGVGVGDAGRVDVALDRVEQRADEVLVLHEREDGLGLGRRDDLQVHAQVPAPGLGHAQPVQALAGVGQHEAARQVDGAALAGGGLDLLVELDGVLLQLGDVGVTVERVHAAGRVPGRAGGQLAARRGPRRSIPPWSGGRAPKRRRLPHRSRRLGGRLHELLLVCR